MGYKADHLYHIYNQGNNHRQLFYSEDNYRYFLGLMRSFVKPHSDIVGWCLMPDHFHLLVYTTEVSIVESRIGSLSLTALSNGLRMLQSTYAQAINAERGGTGSVFHQKTKCRDVGKDGEFYDLNVLSDIHQRPVLSGLVNSAILWDFSSARDHAGLRNGTLICRERAKELRLL